MSWVRIPSSPSLNLRDQEARMPPIRHADADDRSWQKRQVDDEGSGWQVAVIVQTIGRNLEDSRRRTRWRRIEPVDMIS
jgi:hypothetical protein